MAIEMEHLSEKALLFAANLSLPKVTAVNANLGCAHCRDRVTQVISKLAGSKEFSVDICIKQVIVKGDIIRLSENAPKKKTEKSSIVTAVYRFFIKSLDFLLISCR